MTRPCDTPDRTWAWHLLVVGIAAWLAACSSNGGGGGGGGGTPDTTAPKTSQITPASGLAMAANDPIVITFDEPVAAASVTLGGDLAAESDGGSLSTAGQPKPAAGVNAASDPSGDTLTISPQEPEVGLPELAGWTAGHERTLTVDAADLAGNPLQTLHLTFTVVKGVVYVSPAPAGDDANDGTRKHPKATISAAIAAAVSQKHAPGAVLVSEGTYLVDSGAAPPTHVVLAEGISLYGGYSADFSQRDPTAHPTTIEDISTAAASLNLPNRAIDAGSGITVATRVEGFTIQGGGASSSSGIFNHNGASPTIQNNTIKGGSGGTESYGIRNDSSSPSIVNNTINGGRGGNSSYGIVNAQSSPSIENNTIDGGSGGNSSYGILNDSSSPSIVNNTINGGSGGNNSLGIYFRGGFTPSSPGIQNNIIFTSRNGSSSYCIFESSNISGPPNNPTSLKNNDLFDCPAALYFNGPGSGNLTSIEAVNALTDTAAGGNVSLNPVFVDQAGGDWHLTPSSPTEITQGGLDLSGSFTTDKDEVTRTVPWSMGAYEQD